MDLFFRNFHIKKSGKLSIEEAIAFLIGRMDVSVLNKHGEKIIDTGEPDYTILPEPKNEEVKNNETTGQKGDEKMDEKQRRKEILEAFGVTEEDLQKIFNMKEEDISPEYKKIFEKLPREMPMELIKEIKKIQE